MKPLRSLPLLALLLAAPSAADEALSACAVRAVAAVQARYEKVSDLTASFVQESRSVAFGAAGAASSSRGEVVFAKPGRMRWTYTAPEPSLVVSDGEWWRKSYIGVIAELAHGFELSLNPADGRPWREVI